MILGPIQPSEKPNKSMAAIDMDCKAIRTSTAMPMRCGLIPTQERQSGSVTEGIMSS